MSLIEIEGAGSAWICCAFDRALNPTKQEKLNNLPQQVTFDELLTAFASRASRSSKTIWDGRDAIVALLSLKSQLIPTSVDRFCHIAECRC
jgi:hypothetical protein